MFNGANREGQIQNRFYSRERPNYNTYYYNKSQPTQKRINSDVRGKSAQSPQELKLESNVLFFREDRPAKHFIYKAKQILHSPEFEQVELHSSSDRSILTLLKVVEILTKYNYATVTRIKTKTFYQGGQKAAKLVMILARTSDFEKVYQDFEETKGQRFQEEGAKRGYKKDKKQTDEVQPGQSNDADDGVNDKEGLQNDSGAADKVAEEVGVPNVDSENAQAKQEKEKSDSEKHDSLKVWGSSHVEWFQITSPIYHELILIS